MDNGMEAGKIIEALRPHIREIIREATRECVRAKTAVVDTVDGGRCRLLVYGTDKGDGY